jgi:hypothetical protein
MDEKPDREPDLKMESYWFYFKEMVQWNRCERRIYNIRLSSTFVMQYYSNDYSRWDNYEQIDRDVIYEGYINWQVENILLE